MSEAHAHCHYCGHPFGDEASWPRHCSNCEETLYRNPTPVSVLLQPVDDGLLTIRRAIEPEKGELALPGGFVGLGESWEEAAAREVEEETGLAVEVDAIDVFAVESAPDGTLLIFGEASALTSESLPPFDSGGEASERVVVESKRELAFPLHTDVMERWFERR